MSAGPLRRKVQQRVGLPVCDTLCSRCGCYPPELPTARILNYDFWIQRVQAGVSLFHDDTHSSYQPSEIFRSFDFFQVLFVCGSVIKYALDGTKEFKATMQEGHGGIVVH